MHIKYTCSIKSDRWIFPSTVWHHFFLTFIPSAFRPFEHQACFGLAALHKHVLERWHWPSLVEGQQGVQYHSSFPAAKTSAWKMISLKNQSSLIPIYLEEAGFGGAHCNSDTTCLWCCRAWARCAGGRTRHGQPCHAPGRCGGVGATGAVRWGRSPALWVTSGLSPLLPSAR